MAPATLTVSEAGLPHGSNAGVASTVATGSFTVGDPDGLSDIRSIRIGNTELTIGSDGLQGLAGESIKTEFGAITITSVNGGTLSFSYALDKAVDNDSVAGATDTSYVERIPVTVRDATSSASAEAPARRISSIIKASRVRGQGQAPMASSVGSSMSR